MGNEASYPAEICSHFDEDEIKRLRKRFKKLDLDSSSALSVEEFTSMPELQGNPLAQRVIDVFDTDGDGQVDFREFILGTSQFSVRGDEEQKLRFAFSIYDMDKDGYISNGELALPGAEDDGGGQPERLAVTAAGGQNHHPPGQRRGRENLLPGIQCCGQKPGGPQALGDHCVSFIRSSLNNNFFFLLYLFKDLPKRPSNCHL